MISHLETHDKIYIHFRNSGITRINLMYKPTTTAKGWDRETVLFLFGSQVQPWGCRDEATQIESLIEKLCLNRRELDKYILNQHGGGGATTTKQGDGGGYVYAVLRKKLSNPS